MSGAGTGDLITRMYDNFRGADFRGEEVSLARSPDCLNMWRDYTKTASIETRPEMELQVAFDDAVYGIFFYKDFQIVHSGTSLYKVKDGAKSLLFTGAQEVISDSFT